VTTGTGKSTILHTIAKQRKDVQRLAFSSFRGGNLIAAISPSLSGPAHINSQAAYHQYTKINTTRPREVPGYILLVSLQDQCHKLVVHPVMSIDKPVPLMVIIVDGLDE